MWETEAEHGSQWVAIVSISGKVDRTAETLRTCVREAERDTGRRSGQTSDERQPIKDLERVVRINI